jgi:DNA mismatch endonuclease (patch repair protein)
MVLDGLRKIINIHGCFWHLHFCQKKRKPPVQNAAYWDRKRERNRERDGLNLRRLRKQGWRVLTVWECQTRPRKIEALQRRLLDFLGDS